MFDMADVSTVTNSPVIGVLCVDIAYSLRDIYGFQYTSYLAASYVKFIQGGGGRAVPIWIGKDREYYRKILSHLNGVLLPGGAVFFSEKNGFADAGRNIFEIASEMNKTGTYMPILGICLGYEIMLCASAGSEELRQDCDSVDIALPLNLNRNSSSSRLFGNASAELKRILSTENVTFNFHKYCITDDDLKTFKINNYWKVLSTNSDGKVQDYISTVEHIKYPFYGLQFHPEKNAYEHKKSTVPNSINAVRCSNYFAEFFVNETRKNRNSFDNLQDLNKHLIYNFSPIHITAETISWEQCYLFEKDTDYPD